MKLGNIIKTQTSALPVAWPLQPFWSLQNTVYAWIYAVPHLQIFARAEVLSLLCQKAFGVGGWQERKAERRAGGFESGITRQAASPLLPVVLSLGDCRNIFL